MIMERTMLGTCGFTAWRLSFVKICFMFLFIFLTSRLSADVLPKGSRASTQADDNSSGCALSASQGAELQGRLLDGTGIAFIDKAFVTELNGLIYQFGVRPSAFVLDQPGVENGFATRERYNPKWRDGSVVISLALIQAELNKTGTYNNFTMPAIMAHEFGHIYQFKHNSQFPTKLLELQADYLAGWYMGRREGSSLYGLDAFQQDMHSFFEKGDYDFNSPTHHGTGDERTAAIVQGYKNASLSLAAVYSQSSQWVSGRGGNESQSSGGQRPGNLASSDQDEKQEPGQFCPDLKAIIRAGRNGFQSVKGKRDAPDVAPDLWTPTVLLSGTTDCVGQDDETFGPNITCYEEGASLDELEKKYTSLVLSTRNCLSGWTEKSQTRPDILKGVEFSGTNDVKVDIDLTRIHSGDLSLQIDILDDLSGKK
jgi:hypothetical protein